MTSIKGLLAAFCAEALVAALWIILTPSESDRAVLLGLSPQRILLVAAALALWTALLVLSVAAWRSSARLGAMQTRLDRFCLGQKQLAALLLSLIVVPSALLMAAFAVALAPTDYSSYRAWAPATFPLLRSLVIATLPLQLLMAALALESAAYLAIRYRQALRETETWSWHRLGPALLVLGIGLLTAFHWLVLVFQLRFFANNPAWYWKVEPVPFGAGDALFLAGAVLLIGLVVWALIVRRRALAGLAALFLLGLFLQFGIGLMSGGGFAAFQDRYFSTYHRSYISKAAANSVGLLDTIRQYETLYGSRSFTETKPPGLMVFYTALDHIVNGFPSRYLDSVRFDRLASVISYAFPVLAMLLPLAVYAVARRYIAGQSGMLPGLAALLLVLCPNFVLFSLFPDQAIYPLVFLLGALFVVVVVQWQSLLLGLLLGIFLYAAVFFAFTMLPLYPFAGLYLLLHYWRNRRALRLSRSVWLALAIGLGTLLLYLLFRAFLDYDFFTRFARTVTINHNFDFYLRVGRPVPAGPESISTRLAQIAGAAWVNGLDFAAAVGFPISILFLVQAVGLLARLFKGTASSSDLILSALLLSFIILNLAGTAQGEVPRLWLFWLTMVVMIAALQIEPMAARRPWTFLLLALAQLATIFLTFHFQDLRM